MDTMHSDNDVLIGMAIGLALMALTWLAIWLQDQADIRRARRDMEVFDQFFARFSPERAAALRAEIAEG